MSEIKIITNPTLESWQEVIKNADPKSLHIFQSWQWGKAHQNKKSYKLVRLLALVDNLPCGIIQALIWYRFGLAHTLMAGSSGGGGGILISQKSKVKSQNLNLAYNLAQKFFEIAKEEKVLCALLYTDYDLNLSFGEKIEKSEKYTPMIELSKEINLAWQNLDKKTRNEVRKAEKNGVEISLGKKENLKKFLSLQQEVVKKRKLNYINSLKDLEILWDTLEPKGMLKLYLAKKNSKFIGGAIILNFNRNLFYKSGVANSLGLKLYAGNLIQWQVIKDGIKNGFKWYNLEGANPDSRSPLYGIYKFKMGFGAHLEKFYRYSARGGNKYLRFGLEKLGKIFKVNNSFKTLAYP